MVEFIGFPLILFGALNYILQPCFSYLRVAPHWIVSVNFHLAYTCYGPRAQDSYSLCSPLGHCFSCTKSFVFSKILALSLIFFSYSFWAPFKIIMNLFILFNMFTDVSNKHRIKTTSVNLISHATPSHPQAIDDTLHIHDLEPQPTDVPHDAADSETDPG